MKTEAEVKVLLKKKQAELKTYGKPALVEVNAPLALIQATLEGQIQALQFILR